MAMVSNHGQMEPDTRESMSTGRKKEKELFTLLMVLSLKEISKVMKSMDSEFMNGLTVKSTKVSG